MLIIFDDVSLQVLGKIIFVIKENIKLFVKKMKRKCLQLIFCYLYATNKFLHNFAFLCILLTARQR